MDEQLVLTAQTLRLNPHVLRADVSGPAFVVKNGPGRKYLTVTAEQWNLLRNFANPATVPDVLRAVILNRTCVPLREYYELILKALRAGILKVDRQEDRQPPVLASRWPVTLGPKLPMYLTWSCAAIALGLLTTQPFPWPEVHTTGTHILEIVGNVFVGWLLLIAAVSLGQALAASVLRDGGGEVYEPRFHFLRPVPYFGLNLEDACICTRVTQASVASVRLFPVFASAAALWWFKPEWGALHVIAVIAMLHPFDGSAMSGLLSTLCRGLVPDTQKNFLFSLNQSWRVKFAAGIRRVSVAYISARLVWGLMWIVMIFFALLRAVNMPLKQLFGSTQYWEEVLIVFGILAAAALIAYFGPPVVRYLYSRGQNYYRRNHRQWKRWRLNPVAPVPEEQISRLMAESLLFRRLPPAERAALSAAGQTRFYKAWSIALPFSEQPKFASVILSGRVRLYRRLKSGRAESVMTLKEGDVFGVHPLLDPDRGPMQVRALTPVLVLMIPIREFERRVIIPMGAPQANNLSQKVPFLSELPFCANWHPQAVARFTQIASMLRYNSGELIVAERQDSQQFFLIYEGRVVVRRDKRVRARLKSGAFFGEVSLLQNSAAESDVAAVEETRCLTISKSDFLRFMTHNPHVAIQLEEISSKRLGHPVYPCKYRTYDGVVR
ncbi:MAG: cyclic nucleotide-binding domain-containing protein [Nibricoccus sp.]